MQQAPTTTAPADAGNSNAQALQQLGFNHFIHHLGGVDAAVLIILLIMSLLSWYFIIANLIRNALISGRRDRVIQQFWDTPSAQDAIRLMEKQPKSEPFSKIALDAASAAAHHQRHEGSRMVEALNRSEFVDRSLRQAVDRESRNLENGLTVLATVGSAAVFVGLFGTVIGIYRALINLGAAGQSSISAVAGPVGEALIMTAAGLFCAIPAVIAYNAFARANRVNIARFDEFAHDLHDFFATGSRVETTPAAAVAGTRAANAASAADRVPPPVVKK